MAMLRFSMRFRFIIVGASIGSLFTIPMLAKEAGFGFLPLNDDAQFEVYVETKPARRFNQSAVIVERAAREMRALPNVKYTLTTIGDGNQQQANVGRVYVRLTDPDQRLEQSQSQLIELVVRRCTASSPTTSWSPSCRSPDFSAGAKSQQVQYVISGPDLAQLEVYARKTRPSWPRSRARWT